MLTPRRPRHSTCEEQACLGLLGWGLSPVWHTERRHHADGDVALGERAALLVRVVAALRHHDALSKATRERVSSRLAWGLLARALRPATCFFGLAWDLRPAWSSRAVRHTMTRMVSAAHWLRRSALPRMTTPSTAVLRVLVW